MRQFYKHIFIAFFLISFLSTVQVNAQTEEEDNSNGQSYLTVNVFSPMTFTAPRWRVGYIHAINKKWKVGLDVGYGARSISFSDFDNRIEDEYRLWEVRPEVYFIVNPKRRTQKYFSIELFYINHSDIIYDDEYYPGHGVTIGFDSAQYERQKYGIHFKFGLFIHPTKRLGINVYAGVGLRIRTNTYSEISNPMNIEDDNDDGYPFARSYKDVAGTEVAPNISLGVKLFLKLKKDTQ